MKTRRLIVLALTILAIVFASCTKDPDVPTGKVFNSGSGSNGNGTYNGHDYVDLGLPSGTLWATCNVGASSPTGYGNYYAWGETSTKSTYDWSTYKYYSDSSFKLTKYCNQSSLGDDGFTDNLTELQKDDDAATANWGNGWRMPTKEEWLELKNNTTVTWTKQNGVSGRCFTASNGNSLFLPAAGNRYKNSLNSAGMHGHYWSSSLDTNDPNNAKNLYFRSDCCHMNVYERYYGQSVRPVRSDSGSGGGSGGNAPTGAIDGLFSVSSSMKVYFSQGNLQYRASDGRWRFAEHQYDCIGSSNSNISSSYGDFIDLFGWGTSGWNSGAVYYQPWSTSQANNHYYPGGSYTNNLTGNYANADWGVYNKIYNGGNTAGQWRTLTKDEWAYVFQGRSNASSKYGHGSVNGQNGMILLPDNWTLPSGLSFTPGNSSWTNSYTAQQWSQMEANGAVFLPAANYRRGSSVSGGTGGNYWSTSYDSSNNAYSVHFDSGYLSPSSGDPRYYGQSVRLVAPAE